MGLFWSRVAKADIDGSEQGQGDEVSARDAGLDVLVPRLKEASASIREVTQDTEQQFLSIGAHLQEFYADAASVISLSEELGGLIAGDESEKAFDALSLILSRMRDYVSGERGETDQSLQSLENILGLLTKVTESLDGFKKIIKVLHALGTSTKIESVRLGDDNAGFFNLAMDVEKLSQQIKAKSASIMSLRDQLASEIRQTLARIAVISASEIKDADAIFSRMGEVLDIFGGRKEATSAAVASIAGLSSELAATIGNIVSSIQFHDITRQQIEHVHETLDDLVEQVGAGIRPVSELAAEIPSVVVLQAAQIDHAVEEFVDAVSGILSGLSGVAGTSASIASEALAMAGAADGAGNSYLTGIDSILSSVTGILSDSGEGNRNLSAAMVSVGETIGHITGFVNDIEDIGMEIELIALNAQIKAARTGSEGAALGVLAEAIQKLSVEARSQSVEVSAILREVTTAAESLRSSIDTECQALQAEVAGMVDDLTGLVKDVGAMNHTIVPLLQQINGVTRSISARTESMVNGMTVHEELSAVLLPMAERLRALFPQISGEASEQMLKNISHRYTMHSERKVHARIAGVRTIDYAKTDPVPAAAAGDLGDNVELF